MPGPSIASWAVGPLLADRTEKRGYPYDSRLC